MTGAYQIRAAIKACPRGSIFFPEDFSFIGGTKMVSSTLLRLCEDNTLTRVGQGIYCYPIIDTRWGLGAQNPSLEEFDFLEFLLKNKKIDALGEFGFDLFSDSLKKNISNQEKAFNIQLELSLFYNVPVVLHFRKGLEYIYRYAEKLKKLPGVLFHSFFWSDFEALSILNKIESSFFSFGKSLLKLNKKSLSCVKNLPLSAILLETDAPFQTLKNEVYTKEDAIFEVYKSAYKIKKDYSFENKSFFEFSEVLANNFNILLSN